MATDGTALTFAMVTPIGPSFTPRIYFALRSLRAQGVDLQLAFCDAGGSAEARMAADEFGDIIAYRRHGPDAGQSAAINEGWRHLEGDIFGWLNADDYLAPSALTRVAKIFDANEEIDVVYGQSYILDDDVLLGGLHPAVDGNIDLIFRHNLISQPSCFYRARTLEKVGLLKKDLHFTMDWDLWARFYAAGLKFHYTPEILSSVLWEEGTKTSGLSRRRMSEIAHLTSTYENPIVTAKTMVGFTLHHLFEYSSLGPLLSGVRRRLKGTAAQRANMWRAETGGVRGAIPVYHFMKAPSAALRIRFAEPTDAVLDLGECRIEIRGAFDAIMPAAILPGETAALTVVAGGEGAPNIERIELLLKDSAG